MIVSLDKALLLNVISFSVSERIVERSLKDAGVTHKIINLPFPNDIGWIVKQKPEDSILCGVKWVVLDGLDEMEKGLAE